MSDHSKEDLTRPDNMEGACANPGYASYQLAKALETSKSHNDSETGAQAKKKAGKWKQVLEGMLSGALSIGSRTPVKKTPAWATLEVLRGGFASGNLMAGGELQPHELSLAERLGIPRKGHERAALNSFYVSDRGVAELQARLEDGGYRITIPEEGALLIIAWLLKHNHSDEARGVLDEIGPYFPELRFYPVPDEMPRAENSFVHRQAVCQTIDDLKTICTPVKFYRMREVVCHWIPIYDRAAALFAETVEGESPGLHFDKASGQRHITGGWPCQHYADNWKERAGELLKEYQAMGTKYGRYGKGERRHENFARLLRSLKTCLDKPASLTGREVGMIRLILASIAYKRGLPGSQRHTSLRSRQLEQVKRPARQELSRVLISRLGKVRQDSGLESIAHLMLPLNAQEAEKFKLPEGQHMHQRLEAVLMRSLDAPVEKLLAEGVITSNELLARIIPQLTAKIQGANYPDPELGRLYGAIYSAFRLRRSLLLLNLESQVKLSELPWIRAAETFRDSNSSQQLETMGQVVKLALTNFPHIILPNKLLVELNSLARAAGLKIPLVDELAADIFMGTFTKKYLRAAQEAAVLLEGTLYSKYYDIPYGYIRQINDAAKPLDGPPISKAFAALCHERAGERQGTHSFSVARNGKIIEQEQIITTHNLAVLFKSLELGDAPGWSLEELPRQCFLWICWRLQLKIEEHRACLIRRKNTAYAWRQMVFYLSLLPSPAVDAFLSRADEQLGRFKPEVQEMMGLMLERLTLAHKGQPLCRENPPFLGWVTTKSGVIV